MKKLLFLDDHGNIFDLLESEYLVFNVKNGKYTDKFSFYFNSDEKLKFSYNSKDLMISALNTIGKERAFYKTKTKDALIYINVTKLKTFQAEEIDKIIYWTEENSRELFEYATKYYKDIRIAEKKKRKSSLL